MKSEDQIKMDFSRAIVESKRLECMAEQLKLLSSRKMEQSMANLSCAWTGENARLFLQKENQLQRMIAETAKELDQTAVEIRTIARKLYQAEMLAYEIAVQRDKNGM